MPENPHALTADRHFAAWTNPSVNEGVRYEAFRSWASYELATRLCWPRAIEERTWQIASCVKALQEFCTQLSRSGWLFEGKDLAKIIREELDYVAQSQRSRPVVNVYALVRKCLQSYVRVRAEELRDRARAVGALVTCVPTRSGLAQRSMVEILAERETARREEMQAGRLYRKQLRKEEDRQFDLFPTAVNQ
jgi:hypothetical protein